MAFIRDDMTDAEQVEFDDMTDAEQEEFERRQIKQMFEEGVAAGYFEKCRRPDGTEAYRLTEKGKKGDVNWHMGAGNA